MTHSEAYNRAHMAKEWRAWRKENPRIARWAFNYMRRFWKAGCERRITPSSPG